MNFIYLLLAGEGGGLTRPVCTVQTRGHPYSGDAAAVWSVRIFVGAAGTHSQLSLHVAGVGASVRTSSIDEWSSNSASVAFTFIIAPASAVVLPRRSKAVARVPLPNA